MVLQKFSFVYSDSDQVLMWIGSYDFHQLEFHEPAYYGQNYNTMLEALLAAPFFRCAPPFYILPIVTSVLAILPYFMLAIIYYRKKLKVQALFALALPLMLTPEYYFITSIPRGFVTGLFFAVIASISVYYHDKRWSYFFFSFFGLTAFALNPNVVLLLLPSGLFLLVENYKNKRFYILLIIGGFVGAIYPFYNYCFYKKHPNYVLHALWEMKYSLSNLKVGLSDLNTFFGPLTPIFWYSYPFLILLFIAIPVVFKIQKQRICFFISIISIVFMMLTFGIGKIYDGDQSVFLPHSRMFLAIPFMIIFFVSFMKINKWKLPALLITGIACCSFTYQATSLDDAVEKALIPSAWPLLTNYKTEKLLPDCERIHQLNKKFNVERDIVATHWADKFITYACQACNTDMLLVISPSNDRRTWRLLEERDKIYKTILLIDESDKIEKEAQAPGKKVIVLQSLGNHTFLLQNNSLTVLELLKRLKIELRTI